MVPPSSLLKQPEIFCLSLAILASRSLPLLSKGIEKSDMKRNVFNLKLNEPFEQVVSLGIPDPSFVQAPGVAFPYKRLPS